MGICAFIVNILKCLSDLNATALLSIILDGSGLFNDKSHVHNLNYLLFTFHFITRARINSAFWVEAKYNPIFLQKILFVKSYI